MAHTVDDKMCPRVLSIPSRPMLEILPARVRAISFFIFFFNLSVLRIFCTYTNLDFGFMRRHPKVVLTLVLPTYVFDHPTRVFALVFPPRARRVCSAGSALASALVSPSAGISSC